MADTKNNAVEGADSKDGKAANASDAIFMMECLKHLQTPATIDITAVAAAMGYGNTGSVANRIREIRKKFNLQQHLSCTTNSSSNGATATPRKGAKANRGPIKAKAESTEEGGEEPKAEKANPGRKPGAKRGRKPKATAAAEEAGEEVKGEDSPAVEDTA
ncbi:hypothetical protein AJ79_00233 [Helicocarpus griseus UAMH5409]|uniref:Myb-like DNA-binding domain-containing protein n=1 Tax=Helicocarpus griseus UAMH5409 TaxID=1447875 RepID=A0A2B7YC92_9EURO|nr:hypothetical protein AJ79_00233 [Helicocarpus griseus UAMH5409]